MIIQNLPLFNCKLLTHGSIGIITSNADSNKYWFND